MPEEWERRGPVVAQPPLGWFTPLHHIKPSEVALLLSPLGRWRQEDPKFTVTLGTYQV